LRGIGATVRSALTSGADRLIGCSAGNAGLAMALAVEATNQQGKLTLFIPESANPMVKEKLQSFGVDLRVEGKTVEESEQKAKQLLAKSKV